MQVKTETETANSFKAFFDTVNELRNSSSYICEMVTSVEDLIC